jgi:carnitine 3-dehydrogenase
VAAPFSRYRTEVRDDWIDYNGHLHDAGYALVLSEANEVVLADLGLSADYRAETGRAMYTVESHIRYLAETSLGDLLRAASLLVSADPKRMRVHTALTRDDGTLIATGEHLYLHVDSAAGQVTAMPSDRWAAVTALLAAHADLPRPEHLGRGIGALVAVARRPCCRAGPAAVSWPGAGRPAGCSASGEPQCGAMPGRGVRTRPGPGSNGSRPRR